MGGPRAPPLGAHPGPLNGAAGALAQAIHHLAGGVHQFQFQGHLADGMGGAGQAGVVGADGDFDVVEQGFGQFLAVQVVGGHLANGGVHDLVVIGGGDDEVGLGDQAVGVGLVVVEEGAARGLDHADAHWPGRADPQQVVPQQVGVREQFADGLGAIEQLDEPCPVGGEGRLQGPPLPRRAEVLALLFRQGGGEAVAVVDPRQGADPIPAGSRPQGGDEGELHVAPGLDLFVEQLGIGAVVLMVKKGAAPRVAGAQATMVELEGAVRGSQAQGVGIDGAEAVVVVGIAQEDPLHELHRRFGPGDHRVAVSQQIVALLGGEGLVDAAGDGAGAVDALAGGDADDLLTVLAQQHPLFGDVGMVLDDADEVAVGDGVIEAEQQVRRGQVEEMQGVGLEGLAQVHEAADLVRRGREFIDADQLVGGLGGGQMMADRADAAQALHQHRQFPVGPALDEFLEAPELDDVQAGLVDAPVGVLQQGDLAVTLDPGQGIDGDAGEAGGLGRRLQAGDFRVAVHGGILGARAGQS